MRGDVSHLSSFLALYVRFPAWRRDGRSSSRVDEDRRGRSHKWIAGGVDPVDQLIGDGTCPRRGGRRSESGVVDRACGTLERAVRNEVEVILEWMSAVALNQHTRHRISRGVPHRATESSAWGRTGIDLQELRRACRRYALEGYKRAGCQWLQSVGCFQQCEVHRPWRPSCAMV